MTNKKWGNLIFVYVSLCVLAIFPFRENLQSAITSEKLDRKIVFILDFQQIQNFSILENIPVQKNLDRIKSPTKAVIALPLESSSVDEALLRQNGFHIAWEYRRNTSAPLISSLERIQSGDALLSREEEVPGYPAVLSAVAKKLNSTGAIFLIPEIISQKGVGILAKLIPTQLLKTHFLFQEETLNFQPEKWKSRAQLAAKERWVRSFYWSLSPSVSFEKNCSVLKETQDVLSRSGFEISSDIHSFKIWSSDKNIPRAYLTILISVLTPILIAFFIQQKNIRSPFINFIVIVCSLISSGILSYSIGVTSNSVLGLVGFRGVKLQLLLPLLLSSFFFWDLKNWKKLYDQPIKISHVFWCGIIGGSILFLYLMRSGNFPLMSVTDSERMFRSKLDVIFGARPRFKEFFIGHPLLILGLYLKSESPIPKTVVKDWRLWSFMGLIGSISVMNTFSHFHTPLQISLLRTLHGLWLGFLISIPLCWFFSEKKT